MDDDALVAVQRWEASGGRWRVLRRSAGSVQLALVTCVGDEEMGRLESADPGLLAYVGGRWSSDD